jgi:hypothetical protein
MMSLIEEPVDDIGGAMPPPDDGELVHWMDPKPLRIGPAGITGTALAAFTLGAVTAVAVLAIAHWIGPVRTVTVERGSRRG